MEQQIRFCTAPDGVRLAYAVHGRGPPLVRAATWLTHLDFDWESPLWRHWLDGLGDGHTVVRYDERGCGLSDRDCGELSVEAWVADLETVVDAAGLERFALLGVSGGAAVAIVYAARHPERLSHLVLYGGFARGRMLRGPEDRLQQEALISAIRAGWTNPDPAFRHVFSMLFLPRGTPEQMAWFDDLQRRSTSAATAVRLYDARGGIDVAERGAPGRHPDAGPARARRPGRRGRGGPAPRRPHPGCASGAPGLGEPSPALRRAGVGPLPVRGARLPRARSPGPGGRWRTSARGSSRCSPSWPTGLTNAAIAERLSLSVRTVERHLSNVYAKLRVSGKAGRAAAAARYSLLASTPPSPSPKVG